MSGRTVYWPKDAAWWRRQRITEVGLEFGPAGPAILDWLTCEAKAQSGPRDTEGWVKSGYAAIAHGATFGHWTPNDPERPVRPVVLRLAELGLLDEFVEEGATFTCRISGWREDVFLPLEAARSARRRDSENGSSKPDLDPSPATRNDPNDPVRPVRPAATGKGKETKGDTTTPSLRSGDTSDDRVPDDYPSELRPVAEHVHRCLMELSLAKGSPPPVLRRVATIVANYPDHDHRSIVADVCDYWRDGAGARTIRKDFARVYLDRCKHVPAAPARHLRTVGSGDQQWRRWLGSGDAA